VVKGQDSVRSGAISRLGFWGVPHARFKHGVKTHSDLFIRGDNSLLEATKAGRLGIDGPGFLEAPVRAAKRARGLLAGGVQALNG
jgi:hypothetical protein